MLVPLAPCSFLYLSSASLLPSLLPGRLFFVADSLGGPCNDIEKPGVPGALWRRHTAVTTSGHSLDFSSLTEQMAPSLSAVCTLLCLGTRCVFQQCSKVVECFSRSAGYPSPSTAPFFPECMCDVCAYSREKESLQTAPTQQTDAADYCLRWKALCHPSAPGRFVL